MKLNEALSFCKCEYHFIARRNWQLSKSEQELDANLTQQGLLADDWEVYLLNPDGLVKNKENK